MRHLRLTCRALEAKTLFQFGHLNFKTVAIDVSPAGFDKLDGICQHPGLQPHVSGLRLDPKFYVHVDPEMDSASESKSDHVPLLPRVPDPGDGYFDKAVLNFIYRGRMARRLRRSIATLPRLTKLHINPPRATSTRQMSPGAQTRYKTAMASMIKTILDVMCRASINLAKFYLFTFYSLNDHRCAPCMTSLAPLADKMELLGSITRLFLEVNIEKDWNSASSALLKILDKTKKLRDLHLGFDHSIFSGRMLSRISEKIDSSSFSNVRDLGLVKMRKVPSPDLVQFLGKFESSRFELYMVDFDLYPGTWSEIFLYLRHYRPLARLDLKLLWEGPKYISFEKFNAKIGHFLDERQSVAYMTLCLKEWKDGNLGNWLRNLSQLYMEN
ncbi:hypothetical protein IQ07DRAFT_681849 [Pyrenochaeta sp. DS3sAY3a]|nr:hypothetical protein IQ07DRAFT_681849 [Pyrenochaeta sp. DS3sAY3a]